MATHSSNLCLWVPKSGTQPSTHACTHVPTQGWWGHSAPVFQAASRFTLHSPTSLSLVTKRQTSGSQSVFILWLPSWQMHWGRGILTSGPLSARSKACPSKPKQKNCRQGEGVPHLTATTRGCPPAGLRRKGTLHWKLVLNGPQGHWTKPATSQLPSSKSTVWILCVS